MLDRIVAEVSRQLPEFNDYLLRRFRQEKIAGIVDYLDRHFRSIILFKGQLVYVGYHVLSPEERITFLLSKRSLRGGAIQLRQTTSKVVRFDFEFDSRIFSFHVELPYMLDNATITDGTKNYPMLVEVEKVVYRKGDQAIIKAAGAPMFFYRRVKSKFRTVRGSIFEDFVPSAKLHWGTNNAAARRRVIRTPILLYQLCAYGITGTLISYGFVDNEVCFKAAKEPEVYDEIPGMLCFPVNHDIALYVNEASMGNRIKRRVILSLLHVLAINKKFTIASLYDNKGTHFRVVLGWHIINSGTSPVTMHAQACDHLESLRTMMDPATKESLASIGVICDGIFDLLHAVFINLDGWLIYKQTDLYEKQIASLDHLMSGFVRDIMNAQYNAMNVRARADDRTKGGISTAMVTSFINGIPMFMMATSSAVFRSSPDIYGPNSLISVLANRIRSLDPVDRRGSAPRTSIPLQAQAVHPSNIVVESIGTIPSSSPIITGAINPYAQITADGSIIRPDYADEVDHVFD